MAIASRITRSSLLWLYKEVRVDNLLEAWESANQASIFIYHRPYIRRVPYNISPKSSNKDEDKVSIVLTNRTWGDIGYDFRTEPSCFKINIFASTTIYYTIRTVLLRLSVQHLGVTSIRPRLVLVERSVKDLRIVGFV